MFGKSKKAKASYGIVGLGRFGMALAIAGIVVFKWEPK